MPGSHAGPSLLLIELGLTLITVALALCFPRAGSGLLSRLESALGRLARRRALCVLLAGATACALRLLILPLSPIPQPYIHDDFSFLLAADTFVHGRLTNPTPAMWPHFESFHITLKPTYMSMYFPAQGLLMAAGTWIGGHPWWGVWAACGLMCAAVCWMLQGWLPPGWALLGAMLAVIRLALFSYWIDTYTGAGALAALGGALVLGAVPRIRPHFRARDFFWLALGMAILANTRPYEGLLVSIPALVALAWWYFKKPRPASFILVQRIAPAALLLVATFACMGYYDFRVFGNPLTLPYQVNLVSYWSAPHFLWQSARPEPVYRHRIMRDFYSEGELKEFRDETGSAADLLGGAAKKLGVATSFYLNSVLIPPLIMLPWALRDRRIRFLTLSAVVVVVGLAVETFFIPHYLAPAVPLVYALLLQSMRHLRVRGPSGLFIVRAIPVLCIVLAAIRVYAQPLHIGIPSNEPAQSESSAQWIAGLATWYGAAPAGFERARVLAKLERLPGLQLAIVAYAPHHMVNDWVYNAADIDKSKVIWARQMDPASDRELLNYYKDRTAWLIDPDCNPPRVSPFPIAPEPARTARLVTPLTSEEGR